jgi:predicted transcriptional regulator
LLKRDGSSVSGVERDKAAGDQLAAERERTARNVLLEAGADTLDRRPWQPKPVPPSAVDLIQYFVWQSSQTVAPEQAARQGQSGEDDSSERVQALAALGLLRAARAEVDQLETGLLFAARGLGLTWAQMATALGLNSPQACQQRLDRLLARGDQAQTGGVDQ